MINYKETLDNVPKFIAILSAILILLGVASSVVYYNVFSIHILDYLTISEIPFLFLSRFSTLMIGATIGVITGSITQKKVEIALENQDENNTKKVTKKRMVLFPQKNEGFYFSLLIVPAIVGLSTVYFGLIILNFCLRIYVLFFLLELMVKSPTLKTNIVILRAILIGGFMLSISVFFAEYKGYEVYNNIGEKVALRLSTGEEVKSTDRVVFVGKTQTSFFLYDKDSAKSIIIPVGLVEKIEMRY